jgi:glycosyltransferase involved in cell wall biosynthesis
MSNVVKKTVKILKNEGIKGIKKRINRKIAKPILAPQEYLDNIKFKRGYIDIVIDSKIEMKNINLNISNYKVNFFGFENFQKSNYQKINRYTFEHVFSKRSFIYVYEKKTCNMNYCFNINYMQEIESEIARILNTIEGLKLLSNYNDQNNVSVKTSTFFDSFGTNYYSGGAERYLLDLHKICADLNLNLNIYQNSKIPFMRKYNNINVIGLLPYEDVPNNSYKYVDIQTKNYIYHTYNNTILHIYSAFQECFPNHIGPSIGISHGISWDHKMNKIENAPKFWDDRQNIIIGAIYCDKLVSVDTNTANWFQTIDYNLGNHKFRVIPNYVDTNVFKPRENYLKKPQKIIITYPRRLYEPRGLYIALDVTDRILQKYNNVEFHFVGKGFENDIKNIQNKIKKYPNKIFCYSKSPFEMPEVYRKSDISLIPTQYSEGTSLSCLEALASGNVVIATRIGGLTDLIINNLNGYLIEPDADSLYTTLVNAIDNIDKQDRIRKNAIETAEAFNKKIWEEKWKKEIGLFNIKAHSTNNNLIEFYPKDIENVSNKMLQKIKEELLNGNLIYIRNNNKNLSDKITNGLLQVVPLSEEVVSIPVKIYKDKGYKIDRKENCIIEL